MCTESYKIVVRRLKACAAYIPDNAVFGKSADIDPVLIGADVSRFKPYVFDDEMLCFYENYMKTFGVSHEHVTQAYVFDIFEIDCHAGVSFRTGLPARVAGIISVPYSAIDENIGVTLIVAVVCDKE